MATAAEINAKLGELIRLLNPYSQDMKFFEGESSVGVGDILMNFRVEVENYKGEWTFRGSPQKIAKSVRITYQYPIKSGGTDTGICATEHVLIGYAGGNGN